MSPIFVCLFTYFSIGAVVAMLRIEFVEKHFKGRVDADHIYGAYVFYWAFWPFAICVTILDLILLWSRK